MNQSAIIYDMPVIIKSGLAQGRRVVEVECSNEEVDTEGDVVMQSALLQAAPAFVKRGHLDLDHISEIGGRMGIKDPLSYIIGSPTAVTDLGGGRTGVVGEISQTRDGTVDVKKNRFDAFWESLQQQPPVKWRASIYGFPITGKTVDCRDNFCGKATRYQIEGIDWRSLAFTRHPINNSIQGFARVIKAQAFIEWIKSDYTAAELTWTPPDQTWPRTLDELWGQYQRHISRNCEHTCGENSTVLFRDHFMHCCGVEPDQADILAHALMHMVVKDRRLKH